MCSACQRYEAELAAQRQRRPGLQVIRIQEETEIQRIGTTL